jgi:hypothetical protein
VATLGEGPLGYLISQAENWNLNNMALCSFGSTAQVFSSGTAIVVLTKRVNIYNLQDHGQCAASRLSGHTNVTPTNHSQQPTTNSQQPTTNNQQPTTTIQLTTGQGNISYRNRIMGQVLSCVPDTCWPSPAFILETVSERTANLSALSGVLKRCAMAPHILIPSQFWPASSSNFVYLTEPRRMPP